MSIPRLILFCSSTSQASQPCIKFAYQNRLPVQIVRLDTQSARDRASRGKYFQIRVVPTLVVIRRGQELQLFVGQRKVMLWFESLSKPPPRPRHTPIPPVPEIEESEDSSDEFIEEPDSDFVGGLYDAKPKSRKRSKKKRRKKPHFSDSEDDEVEIEFVSETSDRPRQPPTNGLLVGPQAVSQKGKEQSVRDIAKQMEEQRKNSPWFRNDDSFRKH